jgi:glycosyltransferase involved in cell wall biosynthesis
VCCHLGAREHYAMPRALHARARLLRMITDAWVPPGAAWAHLPGGWSRRLAERFHPDLGDADVQAFTTSLVGHEALWRVEPAGWAQLMRRNQWFGSRAAQALAEINEPGGDPVMVCAQSYSARAVFTAAKARRWTTVLAQIDPGEEHFRIVDEAAGRWPNYGPPPPQPPAEYFESWREECRLADWIIVNSEWSKALLERAGVPAAQLRVVPLAYEPEVPAPFSREYPAAFTPDRPLRVLFVGHVSVAKGAAALLESLAALDDQPVVVTLVGAQSMQVPAFFREHARVRWTGAVSRSAVMQHYRDNDVLMFASLSDGFGMAQVEAQAWRLPIVASTSCGRVVEHEVNGLLLDEVSPHAIAGALRRLAANPRLLDAFARHTRRESGIGDHLASALVSLEPS